MGFEEALVKGFDSKPRGVAAGPAFCEDAKKSNMTERLKFKVRGPQ